MGDTEPSNTMLHKNKHTTSSILSYRVGLDPIATGLILQVRLNESATSLARSYLTT